MRLANFFALASFVTFSGLSMSQDGVQPAQMQLAFQTAAKPEPRLDLAASGACKHFVFLAVGNRSDTTPISTVAVMLNPILVLPLAVYQGGSTASWPIVNDAALPPGIEIFLQGVAFRLGSCDDAALTVTEVRRLFRQRDGETGIEYGSPLR